MSQRIILAYARQSVDVIKKAEDSLQGAQCLRTNRKASHEHLYLPLDGKGQTVLWNQSLRIS